jgi:hypothetical protein
MFINPYDQVKKIDGKWIKANFHIHAGTLADPFEIGEVVSMYKKAGYDLITISNHFVLTNTVEYSKIHEIAMINGFEHMEQEELLCLGVNRFVSDGLEHVVNECLDQGGFIIVCHPNYLRRGWWPQEKLYKLKGLTGVEIMNPAIYQLEGSGLATDYWDQLLTHSMLLWGFANDDFHSWLNFGRAWTMIHSISLDYREIKEAIQKGCLYASTGLTLGSEELENGVISISLECGKIDFGEITLTFIGENGVVLNETKGTQGEYRLAGNEKYVRIRAMAESGAQLWTQPVYDDRYFH